MSKYVMSDIHGCYDSFKKMLEIIDFNEETDELYIIGDIFDRGSNPIGILEYIIPRKNVFLIKGNHEKMFEEHFLYGETSHWYKHGGNTTHEQIVIDSTYEEEDIYKYISKLPYIKVVDKFILVHAGLFFFDGYNDVDIEEFIDNQDEDTCIWNRSNIGKEKRYKDYTIIHGHTPIQVIDEAYEEVKMLHRNGTIYIDCGCVFTDSDGVLSCLRLDDMKEFYV